MTFKQATRRPEDGQVTVKRGDPGFLLVSVTTGGTEQFIRMSEYNAARVFAMLGLMLAEGGPPLISKAAGKIKL